MKNSIITVLGTPKSGISILGQCLSILGLTSLKGQPQDDISIIHGLLFQDLDHSPTMAGPLPRGWMQTPGAERARQRINALIADFRNETGNLFLADPFLGRFMPLWVEAFNEKGLVPKFVFMVRHPWEAAPSLAQVENIDLAKAHLLWLTHVLNDLRVCQNQGHFLITFDQLLADPISTLVHMGTELGLAWPNEPWSASSLLLDFVQPSLKHHYASNLPDKDKQKFQAYERLYQEIRQGQWLGMAGINAVDLHPLSEPDATLYNAKGIMPVQSPTIAGSDLVESLLDVVGQYEKRITDGQTEQERIAISPSPQLFTQIVFPSTNERGEVVETIPLIVDEWQHIVLDVPDPSLLRDKSIVLRPLNTNGMMYISAIRLINQIDGKNLWAATKANDFNQIIIRGSGIRLPDKDQLILLVTDDDCQIDIRIGKALADYPVQLELWMKGSKNQTFVHENIFLSQIANQQNISWSTTSVKLNLPEGLTVPDDEDVIIEYLFDNDEVLSIRDKFEILCELGKQHIRQKDNLRAMHFFAQARKIVDDTPYYLLKIASYYLKMNQEDSALELYIISLLKKAFIDEPLCSKFVQKYKQISNKVKKVKEHGQQILMDYINSNIDYLKSQVNRKLTLIEIGTTREDVPGQGSTLKLARFCKAHDFHFVTVDMDPRNTKLAKRDLDKIDKSFQAINQKGEIFLCDYNEPMDFVFLDAYDFDHGMHSEERQSRYEKYLGERISDTACHQMHLECAKQIQKKISSFGVVCFDDTWFKEGTWQAKGTLAVPYLLEKNYWIVLSGNRSVLLTAAKNRDATNIINTLNIHLEYNKREEINNLISLINLNISGRVYVTEYLHGLYLLKKNMGEDCKVYVETGTLFGGSLCLVMQDSLPCTFVGIDLFDGYYGKKQDPLTKMPVSLESTRENVEKFNVHKHDFFLMKGSSYENETVLKFKNLNLSIDLLFIDSDHSYQGVTRDYEAYKRFVNPGGFIVFNNYGEPNTWKEVAEAVADINFEDDDFEKIGQYGYSYIVKKKGVKKG